MSENYLEFLCDKCDKPEPLCTCEQKDKREKIIAIMSLITILGTSPASSEYVADQIIALFPDIEEAKREERERIFKRIDFMNEIGYFDHETYREVCKLKQP